MKTAYNIINMLENNPHAATINGQWKVDKNNPRSTWQSETHFVAVSLLDGIMRGPASAFLWHK